MRILFTLAFAVALSAEAFAAEELKFERFQVGNQTYTNVTVANLTATDVFILHTGGAINFKLKTLSDELQKALGYDADKAAEIEKQRSADNASYQLAQTLAAKTKKPAGPKEIWAKSFLNQKAPAVTVAKWISAKPETQGKYLLAFIWSTTSRPSLEAVPDINRLHQKFGNEVIVIGLSDESEEAVRALKAPIIDFYSGIDPAGTTLKAAEVRALPHVMLVDPDGTMRWEGFPGLDGHELTEDVLRDVIARKENKNLTE